jgi:hypothetical protein
MNVTGDINNIGNDVTPPLTPHTSPHASPPLTLMAVASKEGMIARTASLGSLSSSSSSSDSHTSSSYPGSVIYLPSGGSSASDSSGDSVSEDEIPGMQELKESGEGTMRSDTKRLFSSSKSKNDELKEQFKQQAGVISELSRVSRLHEDNIGALIITTGNMPPTSSDFMPKSLLSRHTDLEKRVFSLEAKNALMTAVMVLMFLKMLGDTYVSLMSDSCECPARS